MATGCEGPFQGKLVEGQALAWVVWRGGEGCRGGGSRQIAAEDGVDCYLHHHHNYLGPLQTHSLTLPKPQLQLCCDCLSKMQPKCCAMRPIMLQFMGAEFPTHPFRVADPALLALAVLVHNDAKRLKPVATALANFTTPSPRHFQDQQTPSKVYVESPLRSPWKCTAAAIHEQLCKVLPSGHPTTTA